MYRATADKMVAETISYNKNGYEVKENLVKYRYKFIYTFRCYCNMERKFQEYRHIEANTIQEARAIVHNLTYSDDCRCEGRSIL